MGSLIAVKSVAAKTTWFWRLSSTLLKSFSTTETANPSSATPASDNSVNRKRKKKKKKNLFEVAQFLPNWGLGYHMAKTHWDTVSYEITKINLYKDGRHGKAWGIAHKDGSPIVDAPKKISGVHKRCWRYIPNSMKNIQESAPKPEALAT